MRKIALVILAGMLFLSTPAWAKEGFYVGAGFIHNKMLNADLNFLDPAVGLDFKAGYNVGPFAFEVNLLGSSHGDTRPGYDEADFGGLNIDFRIPFTPRDWANQVYVLFGLSGYSLTVHDPAAGKVKYSGGGENLGVGVERYFNQNLAFNLAAVYRSIRYDKKESGGSTSDVAPKIIGDTFSVEAGLNYYF